MMISVEIKFTMGHLCKAMQDVKVNYQLCIF